MDEKSFEELNIIPLVDIMLVLLTILLTTATFVSTGALPIKLPTASLAGEDVLNAHVIEIDSDGIIYWESQGTRLETLKLLLSPVNRRTPILIRADKSLPLQGFVDVLDCVKSAGFSSINLQTATHQP